MNNKIKSKIMLVGLLVTNLTIASTDLIFKNGMEEATTMSELEALATSMAPGEWAVLETIGFDDGAILHTDGGGHILEYNNELNWDPVAKKFFVIGVSRGTVEPLYDRELHQKWVQYSEATNTWSELPNPEYYIGEHSYDHAALDVTNSDYYIREFRSRQVWRYRSNNWARIADIPTEFNSCCNSLEYFPEMDAIIFLAGRTSGNTEIFRYNEAGDSWSQLAAGVNMPMGRFHDFIEYSAAHGLLLFGGGEDSNSSTGFRPELYSMDGSGSITQRTDAPFTYSLRGTLTVVEPTSGNLLVFRRKADDGTYFHEYVVSDDIWQTRATHPTISLWGAKGVVATAIPEYDVVLFLRLNPSSSESAVILYKHQPL